MNIDYDSLMRQAREEAKRYHHKYIRTEHLLLAMLDKYPIEQLTQNSECIRQAVAIMHCPTCDAEEKMELSASAKRAFQLAPSIAVSQPLQSHHLLLGILQSSQTVKRLLETCGVNLAMLIESLESEERYGE